jgi:hypothetical protein
MCLSQQLPKVSRLPRREHFDASSPKPKACELQALARYLGSDTDLDDARVLEVAAVFTVSENAARTRMELAVALATRLHHTWQQLRDGRIDGYQARAIAEATEPLTAEQAAAVEARVLPKAPDQAPARLREALRRAVLKVDADARREASPSQAGPASGTGISNLGWCRCTRDPR